MEKQKILLNKLQSFLKQPDYGKVGNDVLYEMCQKYPCHKNEAEIIGKVWLIGRSYAASIERSGYRDKNVSDDFYSQVVAPSFKKYFDDFLFNVRKLPDLTFESMPIILKSHKEISEFINKEITKKDNRSFVSKYLHFHFPSLFFIYDSRVASVISSVIRQINLSSQKLSRDFKRKADYNYDETYALFFNKCFYFQKFCKENGIFLDTRCVDRFLIEEANGKLRLNDLKPI